MNDQKYFLATVVIKQETDSGKTKSDTEKYLVKGYTFTDVEEKVNKKFNGTTLDFSIKSIADSKVIEVIE